MVLERVYESIDQCCGCGACAQACPKAAITMETAADGYLYPVIDGDKCIGCKLCQKKCQYIGEPVRPETVQDMDIYAAHGNAEELDGSASGGLFYVAAKEILQRGGVVFGCQYNDDMAVVHTAAESLEQVRPMRNSKYVQSAIGDTYKQAERHLKEGRPVLYSGTPCQIAGLYNYLGRDYEGLLTMDLICMCVTPPKMFAEYLERLEREAGSKPTFFDFRDKSEGWGNRWNRIEFEDASKNCVMPSRENVYSRLFSSKHNTLATCRSCVYAKMERYADITVGDYWGIQDTDAKIDYRAGVTKVFVSTKKGRRFYVSLLPRIASEALPYETAVRPNLCGQSPNSEQWEAFRKDYAEQGYDYVMEKYFPECLTYKK